MLDGMFVRDGDGGVLSFERHIDRPIEKVWAALTTPERIADWCGNAADVDLRVGGTFRIFWPEGMGVMNGEITVLEPPRRLEYTWHEPSVPAPASRVRWTLSPKSAGCDLKLEHIFTSIDPKSVSEFAGGWDDIMAAVGLAADGQASPMDVEGYKQRQAGYAAKFGEQRP